MYLMYVDECGDSGFQNSPTQYYVLSGVIVHELRWKIYLDQIIEFRRRMKSKYGLYLREEIHASRLINNPGKLITIRRNDRLSILRLFANNLAEMRDLSIINVVVDKKGKNENYDVFENGWIALIQRFENTISHCNFNGPSNPDERGMIIPDNSDKKKLTQLVRKMRRYNPIPSKSQYSMGYRNIALSNTIEDPYFKDSVDSYFIQAADLIAYLLFQYKNPNGFMKRSAGYKYFLRLDPILCKVATSKNPFGIVEI